MLDLLVYVNDNVSCSVITENFDVTLDNFRRETLEEQVSDVLPFNFKFTRLFNKQRIVIGLRQEAALKLSQCIQKVDDHFAVYLLGDEGNNSKASEPDVNQVLTKEGDDDQVPARKKVRSVASLRSLTCADQVHQHPELHLCPIRQLEHERSRCLASKR